VKRDKRIRLACCECYEPAIPATGRLEHDRRKLAWFDGDEGVCPNPKCGAKLRVLVEDDYSDDMIAKVVTAEEYALRRSR